MLKQEKIKVREGEIGSGKKIKIRDEIGKQKRSYEKERRMVKQGKIKVKGRRKIAGRRYRREMMR